MKQYILKCLLLVGFLFGTSLSFGQFVTETAGTTTTVVPMNGDVFTDPTDGTNGGPGGDCTTTGSGDLGDYPNCNCITATTLSAPMGSQISVTFTQFRVFGAFDWLAIFDGSGAITATNGGGTATNPTSGDPELWNSSVDGDELIDMTNASMVTFTSTNGSLTFASRFSGVVNTCGWEADITIISPPTTNDDCADAFPIDCGDVVSGSTVGQTPDAAPFCGTSNTAPGVWYTWTGTGDGVNLSTCSANTNYDSKLTVYEDGCGTLTCVAGNDDDCGVQSTVNFVSVPGVQYLILVHGFDTNEGDFDLTMTCTPPPPNDDVCGALPITLGTPVNAQGALASVQVGEPNPGAGTGGGGSCESQDGWCSFELGVQNSVWYTFVAPDCGPLDIETLDIGNGGDTQIALWEVGDCTDFTTFTEVAANDDGGSGLLSLIDDVVLTAGNTYWLQVDGFGGDPYDVDVSVTASNPVPITISCPMDVTASAGAGTCGAVVGFTPPIAVGGCAPLTITQTMGDPSGSEFPVGVTTIEFTATDAGGTSESCTFTITVTDDEAPDVTCTDLTVELDASGSVTVLPSEVATATDNCPDPVVLSFEGPGITSSLTTSFASNNGSAGNMFDTMALTDITMQSFDINLEPFGGPHDVEVYYKLGTYVGFETTPGDWTLGGTATGLTSVGQDMPTPLGLTMNIAIPAGQTVAFYVTTVTTSGIDYINGGTAGDLWASDANLEIYEGAGRGQGVFTGGVFSPRNFSGNAVYESTGPPVASLDFSCADIGTNTITVIATDASGNESTCTTVITVEDNIAPEVVCIGEPAVFSYSENFEAASLPADWTTEIVSGNFDWMFGSGDMPIGGDFTTNAAIFDDDAIGGGELDNTVRLLSPVFDTDGAIVANLSFDYALQDFAGSGSLSVEVWDGAAWVEILFETEDTDPTPSGVLDMLPYANTNFQVRYTYDDDDDFAWGAGVDTFLFDYEFMAAAPFEVDLDANGMATVDLADLVLSATDNCGPLTYSTGGNTPVMGSLYAITPGFLGTTIARYEYEPATDVITLVDNPYADTGTGNYSIDVNPVTGQGYLLGDSPGTGNRAMFEYDLSTGTLGTELGDVVSAGGANNANAFVFGTDGTLYVSFGNGDVNTVDPGTLTATAFANVTAIGGIGMTYDYDANRIIYATSAGGNGTGNVDMYEIDTAGTVNALFSFGVGTGLPNGCLGTAQAMAYVGNGKIVASSTWGCDIIYTIDLGTEAATSILEPDGFGANIKDLVFVPDASGPAGTISFDCSNLGENLVEITVTDPSGNEATCIATVNVNDVTNPVLICQDATIELGPDGTAEVDPMALLATGPDTVGSAVVIGSDNQSNAEGFTSFVVDITDTATIEFDWDYTTNDAAGFDGFGYSLNGTYTELTDETLGNQSGSASVAVVPGDVFGYVSQTDDNTFGNNETVITNFMPGYTGQFDPANWTLTLDNSDGDAFFVIIPGGPLSFDACGITVLAVDVTEVTCADIGTPITVTVFASDASGNLASCTSVVTVVDALAPEVVCPADQTVDPGPGNLFYEIPDYYATGDATATDNCTDPLTILSQDPAAGTLVPDGTYTITMSATDEYGNVGTCTFELEVISVLGVSDNVLDSAITMFPNPANTSVTLANTSNVLLDQAAIYDTNGRLVSTIDLSDMQQEKVIDVSTLATGVYMVQITSEDASTTKRLIKE